jgi:SAM-dependent methyltransferase
MARIKHPCHARPMPIKTPKPVSAELADWNDRMYQRHATPYDKGLAGTIQRARVKAVLRLARVGPNDAVLELGCEAGRLLVNVPPCRRIVGGDISQRALDDAARLFAAAGRKAEFVQLDAQQPLPFAPGEFDVIICSEMLEHVREPRRVLENIHALAGGNTRVVVTVPIEKLKLKIKKVLLKLGLLKRLFPGIEERQSEWHLHAFSGKALVEISRDLFARLRGKTVWGSHYVALMSRKT